MANLRLPNRSFEIGGTLQVVLAVMLSETIRLLEEQKHLLSRGEL